jgi:hypothetical protein
MGVVCRFDAAPKALVYELVCLGMRVQMYGALSSDGDVAGRRALAGGGF